MMSTERGILSSLLCISLIAACSDKRQEKKHEDKPEPAGEVEKIAKPDDKSPTESACELPGSIPHDVVTSGAVGEQASLDKFSWASFGAINGIGADGSVGTPLWATWSGTSDLLNNIKEWSDKGAKPDEFPEFGGRYLPPACQAYCDAPKNKGKCDGLLTLEQVGKVNDAIFEADGTGLSSNPVLASNGTFIRYEIRINKDMYEYVKANKLYAASNVAAKKVNATCGSNAPGGPEGVINAKLAWMDVESLPEGLDKQNYYTQKRIVFTSGSQRSDGLPFCEIREMGLVGMHIAHKTMSQQSWIWSTFEHNQNAPDCGPLTTGGVNYTCPAQVSENYNFYSKTCKSMPAFIQDPDSQGRYVLTSDNKKVAEPSPGDPCQLCNVVPKPNATGGKCDQDFCVNQGPAPYAGLSRLCRQIPQPQYEDATQQNQLCQSALGSSLWANYMLISTQWYANESASSTTSCQSIAAASHGVEQDGIAQNVRYGKYADPPGKLTGGEYQPQVSVATSTTRARLGNTSMESYEKSNCIGCHAKGALNTAPGADGTYGLPKQGSKSKTLTKAPEPLQSPTYSTIQTGDNQWTQWDFNTPDNTYVHTDFSWWLALEVPEDGVQ